MDPATILSVVATSSKLAKTAWDLGEALYTFTKEARVINKTLANLVEQVRAVRDPCELLAAFLEGIKHDVEGHPEWAATQHGTQLSGTLLVLQRQLRGCDDSLEHLRKSTEGIRASDTNSAKKAWATFRFSLQKDSMRECRSQLSMHLTALNTSLHILNCNMLYLTREPQQHPEDLRQGIEALREQTSDLDSQLPRLSETQDHNQLLFLARETVSDGETIYAQSVAGGSVLGDTLGSSSGQPSSLMAWLQRQVFEASQLPSPPIMEESDAPATAGISPIDTAVEDFDTELDFEHSIISTLLDDARVSFENENYQDVKLRLQTMIATIRNLAPSSRIVSDFFELQYMLSVAAFHTSEPQCAQSILLDFVRQQPSNDEQRLCVAHASQLLAETYVALGNLEAAKSSCANALRTRHRLNGNEAGSKDRCLALAARIETLLGNIDRANALLFNIRSNESETYTSQYSKLTVLKSLSAKQRTDLSTKESRLFQGFRVNNIDGTLEADTAARGRTTGMTPLHFAALFHDIDYALSLIAGGADVNAKASPTSSGSNWYPSNGLTPLICALIVKHEHMIRLLVSKGASLALATTNEGFAHVLLSTAPYELGFSSTTDSILKCMRHLGWDIDSFLGETGHSLLHGAAGIFDAKFAEALMSLGSNPTIKDEYGYVPIQIAIHYLWEHPGEWKTTMDTLLQRDSYAQLNSQDKNGRAALHTALCDPKQLKHDKDKRAALHSTLYKRGNPNDQPNIQSKRIRRDSLGRDLVRAALVDYLVASGSNVLLKDKRGDLPLNYAVLVNDDVVIRMLLQFHKKEQLISRNSARQTALRIAVTDNSNPLSTFTVATLLEAGGDILEVDDDGVSLEALIREDQRYGHLLPLLEGRS